jgi:hypothetical protein
VLSLCLCLSICLRYFSKLSSASLVAAACPSCSCRRLILVLSFIGLGAVVWTILELTPSFGVGAVVSPS